MSARQAISAGFAASTFPSSNGLGGAGGASLLFPSVATFAALTALPVPATGDNGLPVYVASVKDYFHLDLSSTLTVDGVTVLATSLGGTTRWIRLNIPHPSWLLQAAWGINPTTGNDENVGSVASPLKTFAELARRWGPYAKLAQNTTVAILGNLPATDPISFKVELINVRLTFTGTVTVIRSGSFTGVVARAEATNTPWQVTDGAMVGTWTDDITRRIKLTSGAGIGGYAYVAKDLGAQTARTSEWATTSPPPSAATTFVVPGIGDTYNVESVSSAYIADVDVRGTYTSGAVLPQVSFIDLTLSGFWQSLLVNQCICAFYGCRFAVFALNSMNNATMIALNCDFAGGLQVASNIVQIDSGLSRSNVQAASFGFLFIDGQFMVQGAGVGAAGAGIVKFATMAVFDAAVSAFLNPLGAAVYITNTATLGLPNPGSVAQCHGNHAGGASLWGSGNAGPGVDVHGGTFVYVNVPTIVGSIDFSMGGSVVSWPYDPATGTYNGGAAIANAWANLPGALPAAFNHNAHYPARNCHLYQIT